jgi:hypothetical protein
MSENTPEVPGMTPEQVEARVKEMQAAVAAFTADPRHERYRLSAENKNAIEAYLEEHNLDLTEDSLHLAFTDLSKAGKLSLYEPSKLPPPKENTEGEKPAPILKETDLSVGLATQQQLRRGNVATGPRSSHRDAFIRARQDAPSQKVSGGRFHL